MHALNILLWQHFFLPLDTCDPNWFRARDGLIGSGFTFSILVLGLATIELLIVIIAQIKQKKVVRYYLKFHFG